MDFLDCNSSFHLDLKQHAPTNARGCIWNQRASVAWTIKKVLEQKYIAKSGHVVYLNPVLASLYGWKTHAVHSELQPWLPLYITSLHDTNKQEKKKKNHFRLALRPWCLVTTETTNLCTLERKTWKERGGEREEGARRWVKAGCWELYV